MTLDAQVRHHRKMRTWWLIGAAVFLPAGIVIHLYARGFENIVTAPASWIWFVAGALYNHGWLRAHRDIVGTGGPE